MPEVAGAVGAVGVVEVVMVVRVVEVVEVVRVVEVDRVVVPAFQDQMLSLVGGCHKQVRRGKCQGWWMRSCW